MRKCIHLIDRRSQHLLKRRNYHHLLAIGEARERNGGCIVTCAVPEKNALVGEENWLNRCAVVMSEMSARQ